MMEQPERSQLRRVLVERFSESELRDLAFDAGADYDVLPGTHKGDKAREIVLYFEHRHRIAKLIRMIQELRPDIHLSEVPFDRGADLVWITPVEAMGLTGCGSTYLSRLAAEGRVGARQEGDGWLFDRELLLAHLGGWIGTEEASEVTDYTVAHIRWLAREGVVRSEKVRGIWLVNRESLLAYCRDRGQL
jgi:hypothetical protein